MNRDRETGAGRTPRGRTGKTGQYLVEFAMAIVIFIFVFVSFVELGLAVYNYRLMNAAAISAARLGVKGATDDEMKWYILQRVGSLYPTAFLKVDFGPRSVEITPSYADRMQGTMLTVRIDLIQGVSLAGYFFMKIDFPISVNMPMACDVYLDTDADGKGDYTDPDDDNDGFSDAAEIAAGTDQRDASAHP